MRIETPDIYAKIKKNVIKEGDNSFAEPFTFVNFVKTTSKKSNGKMKNKLFNCF